MNRRCSPTSAEAGESPPGSLPRCSAYVSLAASVPCASAGSLSSRVTWTPGMVTSEKPAPDSPGLGSCESRMVIFSHFACPTGALTVCGSPFGWSGLSAVPRSVCTRTSVGAARVPSPGSGVSWIEAGIAVGVSKATRSHWPTGWPGVPSAHAVSGLPSKAFTGSYCGSWKSQLPLLEAVTEAAPRSTAVVWWRTPPTGRICLGGRPASWRLPGGFRSSGV